MNKRLLIIALLIIGFYAVEASGADWKFLGGSDVRDGEKVIAYYDAESLEYLSNGNVRLWTKAVYPSEVERIANKKDVIEKAAKKVVDAYFPPYVLLNPHPKTSYDDYVEIIAWEEAANHAEIEPRARFLFEINCKEKTIRTLSTIFYKWRQGGGELKNSCSVGSH